MDIRDFKTAPVPPCLKSHTLECIWQLQRELCDQYIGIEKLPQYPINIHLKESQILIKDFIGRVVEELAEGDQHDRQGDKELYQEEVIDALHFITELALFIYPSFEAFLGDLLGGIDKQTSGAGHQGFLPMRSTSISRNSKTYWFWNITYHLKIAANSLKNKPWKQTQMRTQVEEFYTHFIRAYILLLSGLPICGIKDYEHLYQVYYRKNQVNRFRIKSKY